MYSVGLDIGSSSVKVSIIDIETGMIKTSGFYPTNEMEISSQKPGYAEQNPDTWWEYVKLLTRKLMKENKIDSSIIKCIGITYQMHGLVLVDKDLKLLRPSIIWCDSRAVETGRKAFHDLGEEYCLNNLLNSPGNFTASKLKWVKDNEPDIYKKIYKIMLPGDYIALKLSGEITTTITGLTEGTFWNFKKKDIDSALMNYYGFDYSFLSQIKPVFSEQGYLTKRAADELGLTEGIPVSYRAGDQPNNAFSLNALNNGECAATAGTSGVIYAVTENQQCDSKSRVNAFAHVNYTTENNLLGILLCINGTGILYSWLRKNFAKDLSYEELNLLAESAEPGSKNISALPFGNGAERVLENKNVGCHLVGIDFNRHTSAEIFRAAQEGIAFSFKYGFDIMKEMGIRANVIRAGKSNMFLSRLFAQTLSDITNVKIELYNTDGACGAARGAAIGAGFYKTPAEAFSSLKKLDEINPAQNEKLNEAYNIWLERLNTILK